MPLADLTFTLVFRLGQVIQISIAIIVKVFIEKQQFYERFVPFIAIYVKKMIIYPEFVIPGILLGTPQSY